MKSEPEARTTCTPKMAVIIPLNSKGKKKKTTNFYYVWVWNQRLFEFTQYGKIKEVPRNMDAGNSTRKKQSWAQNNAIYYTVVTAADSAPG